MITNVEGLKEFLSKRAYTVRHDAGSIDKGLTVSDMLSLIDTYENLYDVGYGGSIADAILADA